MLITLRRRLGLATWVACAGLAATACGTSTEISIAPTTAAAPSTTTVPITTTTPSTTAAPTTTTTPPPPPTTVDPNRIDATTVLQRGRFGPIRSGMTVAQVTALLGPLAHEPFDDSEPNGAYCGSFPVPGAPDVYVGVYTERGGQSQAEVEEIGIYDGTRPSEFGIRIGDPAGSVMAARVENLVRQPHVYDPAGAYLESDTAGGGFRFQVSDGKVTAMQTGPSPAEAFSVEGFCV